MQVNEVILELMVENVDQSVQFYQDILGFQLIVTEPAKAPLEWAKMQIGGLSLSFKAAQKLKGEVALFQDKPVGGSVILCVQTQEVQGIYERLKGQVKIVNPLHVSACGSTEFTFEDNNGYLLTFEQLEACLIS